MATNSEKARIDAIHKLNREYQEIRSWIFHNWQEWSRVCENLMLGYSEWRMRCYSETITQWDYPWHSFKIAFDSIYSAKNETQS